MDTMLKPKSFHSRHQSFPYNLSLSSRTLNPRTIQVTQQPKLVLSPLTVGKIQKEFEKIDESSQFSSEHDLVSLIKSLVRRLLLSRPQSKNLPSDTPKNFWKYFTESKYKTSSSPSSFGEGTEIFDEKIRTLSSHEIFLQETLRKVQRKEKTLDSIKKNLLNEKNRLEENQKVFQEMKKNLIERLQIIEEKVRRITEEFLKFVQGKHQKRTFQGKSIDYEVFAKSSEAFKGFSRDLDEIVKKHREVSEDSDALIKKTSLQTFEDPQDRTGKSLLELEENLNNLDSLLDQIRVVRGNDDSQSSGHRKSFSNSENFESDLNTTVISQRESRMIQNHALIRAGIAQRIRAQNFEGLEQDLIEEKKKLKRDSETLFKIFQELEIKRKLLEDEKNEISKERVAFDQEVIFDDEIDVNLSKAIPKIMKKKSLHFVNNDCVIRIFDSKEKEHHIESIELDESEFS